ncbi:MAG: helix-turn-helix domain-containing protein [Clostridiaceae bacterium]|nr:helix-turn-helix domain-containing protein [Clostridiaceae bacterium]
MANHPLPETALLSLDGVRYEIRHINSFIHLDEPDIDESHIHNSYELYINVSGDVSFLVENRLYPIRSGDAVMTRPGEMHLCVYHNACIHEHFCLWIDMPEGSTLLSFLHKPGFNNLYSPDNGTRQQMLDLLYRLNKLSQQNGRELGRTVCFLQLLSLFNNQTEPESKSRDTMPDELQQMLNYLNEHFREIQHVREMCDLFFISQSSINRLFRKYIHLSPREFLESKKLACAQQLLASDRTVTQVCQQCGFVDCSHFIAVYKKKFGETPYQYKMSHKNKL